jgi:hypothetical protein
MTVKEVFYAFESSPIQLSYRNFKCPVDAFLWTHWNRKKMNLFYYLKFEVIAFFFIHYWLKLDKRLCRRRVFFFSFFRPFRLRANDILPWYDYSRRFLPRLWFMIIILMLECNGMSYVILTTKNEEFPWFRRRLKAVANFNPLQFQMR